MKALFIDAHGDPESVIKYGEVAEPKLAPGHVLVSTRAAALNRLDLFVARAIPGAKLQMPHVLGSDGAGVVLSVPREGSRFRPGDRVMLNPLLSCGVCEFCRTGDESLCIKVRIVGEHAPGTFGELFSAPQDNLHPMPETCSFEEAAAFSLVFQTAWRMLVRRARLTKGEDVFIHGIGSGVSTAALAIARHLGARVFVTSSSDEKLERAKRLGAEFTYNYQQTDYVKQVLTETGKRGVDVVVDSVGAETWVKSLQLVRRGGRVVTCGATSGPNPKTEIRLIFWKQIEILGSTMSSQEEYREVAQLFRSGHLHPTVDRVFPLEEGKEALAFMEQGRQFGKVVLSVP